MNTLFEERNNLGKAELEEEEYSSHLYKIKALRHGLCRCRIWVQLYHSNGASKGGIDVKS